MANGGIPTGGSPLFLGDFSSNMNAISQKLTDRFIQDARQKKAEDTREISRSKMALLKALDFGTVEGMSKQVQREHLDSLNALSQKWTERMYERGNKLTTEDYLELNTDKQKMEQDVANKRHNVSTYNEMVQQVKQKPWLYDPDSLVQLEKWSSEGNLGRSTDGLLKPYFNTMNYLGQNIDTKGMTYEQQKPVWDKESDFYQDISDNSAWVDEKVDNFVKGSPVIQAQLQKGGAAARNAQKQIDSFKDSLKYRKVDWKNVTSTMRKEHRAAQLPESSKAINDQYGWVEKGLAPTDVETVANLNDFAYKMLQKDSETLNSLKNKKFQGKVITGHVINNEGDIELYTNPTKGNPTGLIHTFTVPDDWGNNADVHDKMVSVMELKPSIYSGKSMPKNIDQFLEPKWQTDVGDVEQNTYYTNVMDELDKKDPDKKLIASNLKQLNKDLESREYGTRMSFLFGGRGVKWDDQVYRIDNEEDRELLKEKMREVANIVEPASPAQQAEQQTAPAPQAEQQSQKAGETGDWGTYEEAFEDVKKKFPQFPDEKIDEMLREEGFTPETPETPKGGEKSVSIPDSSRIASVHNNPGNLQFIGQKGAKAGEPRKGVEGFHWAKFDTPEEGFQALVDDIKAKQKGKTTTGLSGKSTVAEFVKIYADENAQKTKNYLSFLEKEYGIKPDSNIGSIDPEYLAEAVARQESSTKILASK